MKSTTVIVMGVRNVGVAEAPIQIFHGTFAESIIQLGAWLASRSIATRIDMVIARSEEEVRNALRVRGRGPNRESLANTEMVDTLLEIMNQAEGQVDANQS